MSSILIPINLWLLITIIGVSAQEPPPGQEPPSHDGLRHHGYKATIMGHTYDNVLAVYLYSMSSKQPVVDADLRHIYDLTGKALKEGEAFVVFPAEKGVLLLVDDTRVGDIVVRTHRYPGRNFWWLAGPPEDFIKKYTSHGKGAAGDGEKPARE